MKEVNLNEPKTEIVLDQQRLRRFRFGNVLLFSAFFFFVFLSGGRELLTEYSVGDFTSVVSDRTQRPLQRTFPPSPPTGVCTPGTAETGRDHLDPVVPESLYEELNVVS